MTLNMMIGLPAMVYPSGWKARRPDRWPSWKIQTIAPKLAVMDRRVMITALSGRTTDPNSRNRIAPLAMRVRATAYGARSDCETRKSWPIAALPPTRVAVPGLAGIARIAGTRSVAAGWDGGRGLMASSWTVEPRMYCASRASRPGGRWPAGSA